jgi:cobalt-zinc-cadmium resistance protein CzcA
VATADTTLIRMDYVAESENSPWQANPSLGYIKQQVEMVRLEKKLEQSRALPEFSVGYFSQTMLGTQEVNGLPRTFTAGDRLTGIQAGIAIPLWFSPNISKIKAAKIKEEVAINNADYYKITLAGKYQSLLDDYAKYRSSVDYYEKQAIPEAALIIDQSTRSYKAGALDYLNYVLSLSRALSIKMNYLETLNNYNQTIINIEFITGKLF